MNTPIRFFVTVLLCSLYLISCSSDNENQITEGNSAPTIDPNAYQFKEGEQIHWEVSYIDGYVVFNVSLAPGWMTYSQYNTNILGPLPSLISFDSSEDYELVGDSKESLLKSKFEEESNMDINYFEKAGVIMQQISPKSGKEFVISGTINYMVCNSEGCLPPTDHHFEITVTP